MATFTKLLDIKIVAYQSYKLYFVLQDYGLKEFKANGQIDLLPNLNKGQKGVTNSNTLISY